MQPILHTNNCQTSFENINMGDKDKKLNETAAPVVKATKRMFSDPKSAEEVEEDNSAVALKAEGNMGQSIHSAVSSTNAKYPTAREISESVAGKLIEMRWVFISFLVNALFMVFFIKLGSGMSLPIGHSSVSTIGR
jgi:hypothetical protein